MDAPVLEPVKPDPTYGIPHTNIVQSNYSLNSLSSENGQNLGKFSEPTLLPASQYLPMSPSYPAVTPIMPHHYLNMSTSSNILSDLLPPMSMAPSFTTLSLDINNPPLPHFNQAFQ
ncbi:zinc finger protein PLAGL1 [Trichonephila inaurata madagascariensis]|uniref:Zinc finger protein PLAGL1 n=1 Tax=Trichonephila inaurata madagascariensis TaxID=2747483 RepID=A0A8X7CLA4_9ARAC|nr:zinc finger protein PLAGL1 [Trichonephila inaurata madagascariensis]